MTIASSAIVAIAAAEPEAARLLAAIAKAEQRWMASVTLLECQMVMSRFWGPGALDALDQLIDGLRIEVLPFTKAHAAVARDAFRRFGKGVHPAGLNLGDCCTYALSAASGKPLLFKGDDFSRTDLVPVAW